VQAAVAAFGTRVAAKLANPAATGQPEDQLRGPLEALMPALAVAAGHAVTPVLVGETKHAATGSRPDYSVTVAGTLVGFIELKAPGKGADPNRYKGHDKEQWDKLKALPNLLYTDGQAFALYRDGERVGEIVRLSGDLATAGPALAAPAALEPLIADFLTWRPIAPTKPEALAITAARLCRFLRDEVLEQLANNNADLKGLAADWRALLFPDASDDRFADGYAQAVTFGLLMAKSRKLSLADGLDRVAKGLGRTDTLIGAALRLLTDQDVLAPALAMLVRVLDVVEWDVIAKGDPEAWLYFYEQFLAVYDNSLRKLTGSYYTPPEVVQTMVRLCDEALKSPARFGRHKGLADPDVEIADPAVGSGTFLLALLRHIARAVERDQGKGAVGAAVARAATRLFGFELQFGAYAVAELRLMAEMIDLGASGTPRLFVSDTLSDPYAPVEAGQGIYREISRQHAAAAEVKRTQPITVVIGNPPYKEKAKGRGGWVEAGSGDRKSGNRPPILDDWQPPVAWGAGAHAKHLRNLYVYFWRWAAWKVFEQGSGGRDRQPPVAEPLSGLVCYITVAGFLNGPGFQKMRADLRRDCDAIWVIDCSPEGHQPEVASRIFQGVQHPVCIVLAARSPANDPAVPAHVRFRALAPGRREAKFAELAAIALDDGGWRPAAAEWRAPFLPELGGGWADFVPLDAVIGDSGSGVMPGRTWIIAPDAESLRARWAALVAVPATEAARKEAEAWRAAAFHPHLRDNAPGDRHIDKPAGALPGHHPALPSIAAEIARSAAGQVIPMIKPIRHGYRSFDRQWIIPDKRLINQTNPRLWEHYGSEQVFLTALMVNSPDGGPAATLTSLIPDLSHYKGSFGGRVFALWQDAAARRSNVADGVLTALARQYGATVDPVDVFAYVAALLAQPAFTARYRGDLIRPGLRAPLTADRALFAEAAALGREVIWLHSFGERMAGGRPPGLPRLPEGRRPFVPAGGAIPTTSDAFPDTIDHDAATQRLHVGTGVVERVTPAMWAYEVSGKNVLRQWFSYRRRTRERPQIGDRRKPSPLGDIQPDAWLAEYTSDLIDLLNVLGLLIDLEPRQADLLARIEDGPLIPPAKLAGR
ncbi:MAG: N-6 DNA methylase, partial [Sphingomonadaceae bacterium]|nr:N-6 DNA methylase [Sphingomonadaceae bacterium]